MLMRGTREEMRAVHDGTEHDWIKMSNDSKKPRPSNLYEILTI